MRRKAKVKKLTTLETGEYLLTAAHLDLSTALEAVEDALFFFEHVELPPFAKNSALSALQEIRWSVGYQVERIQSLAVEGPVCETAERGCEPCETAAPLGRYDRFGGKF